MTRALLFLTSIVALGQVGRDVNRFRLPDGAEIEFASPVAFRYSAKPSPTGTVFLTTDPQTVAVEEKPDGTVQLSTRFIEVLIGRDHKLRVRSTIGTELLDFAGTTDFGMTLHSGEAVYGLGVTNIPTLNLRGHAVDSRRPFLFTSRGYGLYLPNASHFDVGRKDANKLSATWKDPLFFFYYGPAPKEILEQHVLATHSQSDLPEETLVSRDPKSVHRLVDITDANYCDSPRILNQLSLSGDLFPALDLAKLSKHEQLIRLLPFLYDSKSHPELDQRRLPWEPYLLTYLREAHDRGLPFVRPLMMQFPKDPDMDLQKDVYMIGDEILVAPGCEVTKIQLPRGYWTDLRTNKRYAGRQVISNESEAGVLPVFAKSGSLIPLNSTNKGVSMELHYFPNQGAEFFVYEPEPNEYSQFHAAPAGDYTRVESESKIARTYEWILHHSAKPEKVGETGNDYREVESRAALKPRTWFHDAVSGNLHIVCFSGAGEDHIINMQ